MRSSWIEDYGDDDLNTAERDLASLGVGTRTRNDSLEITDTFDPEHKLIIQPNMATITLITVERDTDQRAAVVLGAAELDELAAEILRIREERSI